jgi:hypothetical protein
MSVHNILKISSVKYKLFKTQFFVKFQPNLFAFSASAYDFAFSSWKINLFSKLPTAGEQYRFSRLIQ